MSYQNETTKTVPANALNYEIDTVIETVSAFLTLLEYFKDGIQQLGAATLTPPAGLPSLPSIGERIRFVRMVKGITQEELAARVGVSRATINYAEKGKSHPNGATATALAKALDCNHFWLVTGAGNPHPTLHQEASA